MAQAIGYDEMVAMLRGAVQRINDNHEILSKLDSFGGDGDHGTTMVRAMKGVEKSLEASEASDLKTLLHDVGWGIMGVDGGATGPLFGTLFMSMSEGVTGDGPLDAAALAAAFESGLAGVQKQTKAQVGDKTLIDVLVPAVAKLREAADGGADAGEALKQAAQVALAGAESTQKLQARFGRARNLGEGSIGHQDPGATSMSLIFKAFAEAAA
ncbi:MAG TPA: dihydroxyacetone kinase subunit DhaL [Thermoguttaceae bacterium]|nr:dihydroxyacetone kinase subunit DhaL [Thermoguttaceae bacterium]